MCGLLDDHEFGIGESLSVKTAGGFTLQIAVTMDDLSKSVYGESQKLDTKPCNLDSFPQLLTNLYSVQIQFREVCVIINSSNSL
jgi:hypothetical protein